MSSEPRSVSRSATGSAASARQETRALVRLATPIALAHLGNQALSTVDMAVVGRLGEVPLGAVGLGSGLYFAVTVVGLGLMLGLDPLIAQALGADEPRRARGMLWQGGWIALLATAPLSLAMVGAVFALEPFGIEAETARETGAYVFARLPGLFFLLLFVGGRSYLTAHGITAPMVVGVVIANVINFPLSWLLVFGDAGLEDLGLPAVGVPAMGAAGAGWTSTACTVIQCGVVLWAVRLVSVRDGDRPSPSTSVAGHGGSSWRHPERRVVLQTVRLGAPIALALLAEVGSFSLVGLLAALLGSGPLAAHNVALILASTTFQVPLAIGAAASVRVGRAVGRRDGPGARRAGLVAIAVGAAFMAGCALSFLALPTHLARVISNDPEVVAAAGRLLLVAAGFQLVDGIQTVAAGALRGAGDTRFPMLANVVGHYVIGLPAGILLAFGLGWGAMGLWWGLSIGLSCVALALATRFLRISRGEIARA